MSPSDAPINWKRNLAVAWFGCFLTGAAFSLVMPFLPLYVEQLGVTGHSALNMWSGLVFSITFLFSAIASPFWGGLADRKGRKIMLLRSALGMSIIMVLMGLAQNVWQLLILRALLGLLGGFVPNANALIATQIPRHKSGWALGTLSTGAVSGALLGPLAGGVYGRYLWPAAGLFYHRGGAVHLFYRHLAVHSGKLYPGGEERDAPCASGDRRPEKSETGVKSLCHDLNHSGCDRLYSPHPYALCARFSGQREQYRLY